ncbi:MAG: FAD-dependent monooxygenase [Hydrogenophaga sp.]|uniref:FAD-dependent monooxygenase n=1 Tax=Hydrogenophaga sp. TaxID=1904254 RepID=UPI001D919E9B|nr:FAD-dependent monooxygenase [Hydrogenophaga sp.]MBX3610327.1 FAD-dependent monooxygenase [Hydrogenophaga sp.]
MSQHVLVAGGGIGGLGATIALARQGVPSMVVEQAQAFGEVGAGLQLGPNAVRVLADWGLRDALDAVAAWPEDLCVRDAADGRELGHLRLGSDIVQRHGQPYACLHRADLHALLLHAAQVQTGIQWHLATRVAGVTERSDTVKVALDTGETLIASAVVGADGLWSRVRHAVADTLPPQATGHIAYRGLIPAGALPEALRTPRVQVWLGPHLHVVHYPVRRGEAFNVVAVASGRAPAALNAQSWSEPAAGIELQVALGSVHPALSAWLDAVSTWTRWVLHDRAPLNGPHAMASERIALLGDAAHPMRPYLAQGAAMALEDAWVLGRLVADPATPDWPQRLARYAALRWARNAKVQSRSRRNGVVFHARGPLRWARNAAMALLGERLMDNAWLYRGPGTP